MTFEEKYTYDASEADSKLTCRTISLLQVKRLLLEKLGTYIETKTEVANYQITRDEIAALSAAIIKTEILEEKWDGKIYSLTAKIDADPDSVAKAIKEMKGSREGEEKANKLENVNEKYIEQINELKEEKDKVFTQKSKEEIEKWIKELLKVDDLNSITEEKFQNMLEDEEKKLTLDDFFNVFPYIIKNNLDEKKITAQVKVSKGDTSISQIEVWDEGTISTRKL